MKPQYRFEEGGVFTLTHYNAAPPFASFLPGIAGLWGIPLWAFYVNRGQAICSFGLRDKDHAISEFVSANAAYARVFTHGFRTLIQWQRGKTPSFYEPFRVPGSEDSSCVQTLRAMPHAVEVHETHHEVGLHVRVEYFTLPEEPVAALVRCVTLRNLAPRSVTVRMLDGLAEVLPFGVTDDSLKHMRYLTASYAQVTGLERRVPHFHTKVATASTDAAVVEETGGAHFAFGVEPATGRLLEPIVDPSVVFGPATDLSYPIRFAEAADFAPPRAQATENLLPCGLFFAACALAPGEERVFCSFFGTVRDERRLRELVARAREKGFVAAKRERNRVLIEQLTQGCAMVSAAPTLDAYARQNLLDNQLRGGHPVTLAPAPRPVVLSVFSRKHGDLERDYNPFILEPTFLSQGDGNYRDVNQNRRHHVFLNPDVGAETVRDFVNLIQPDGFNPLIVRPKKFRCRRSRALRAFLAQAVGGAKAPAVEEVVARDFEPGGLFARLEELGARLRMERSEFLEKLLRHAVGVQDSEHGHGYWTDHWFYNLDLIESFRGIYPERVKELLFGRRDFVYCDTHVFVRPRAQKYQLWRGRPVQQHSLEVDARKRELIAQRAGMPHAVRTRHGHGPVYYTTLAPKLLALAAVKVASLDAFGVGVEMEADRPNWCDALNGLPGQFGSSTCETFELKRLLLLLKEALGLAPAGFRWRMPAEIAELVRGVSALLRNPPQRGSARQRAFDFWDRATSLKETFRERVRFGFEGREIALSAREVEAFVAAALEKVEDGLRRAFDPKTGLYHAYFRHQLVRYRIRRPRDGAVRIQPLAFRQIPLPLYLEGQVHALRLERDPARARAIVRAVRRSALFDRKLKMYKVNAPLDRESHEIGRARTFPPGWLENESIWMHMHYKFLLEILRSGLPREFFREFRRGLVPFLDPEVYGRSITENSSFIVSAAYPDPRRVGKGYMARLSGATAEFVHMWVALCSGERPFRLDSRGRLQAVLEPCLPSWLFTRKASEFTLYEPDGTPRVHRIPPRAFAFVFLGHTLVVYLQKGRPRDTFGPGGARVRAYELTYRDGRRVRIEGPALPTAHALALRSRQIATVRAELA